MIDPALARLQCALYAPRPRLGPSCQTHARNIHLARISRQHLDMARDVAPVLADVGHNLILASFAGCDPDSVHRRYSHAVAVRTPARMAAAIRRDAARLLAAADFLCPADDLRAAADLMDATP